MPKIHIHIPAFYVGGIEQWALAMMKGILEVTWSISAPRNTLTHIAGIRNFKDKFVVEESQIPLDADLLIACCPLDLNPIKRTIFVAHGVSPYHKEIAKSVRYDLGVAVSRVTKTIFPEGKKVAKIYNGIDLSRLVRSESSSQVRRRLGIPKHATVVGHVGRWSAEKNPLAAAKAASLIKGGIALYVGPQPTDIKLVEYARSIADCRFISPEQATNIADLYGVMDACIIASKSEGFCLAMTEAWYSFVPVVSTNVGIGLENPGFCTIVPFDPSASELTNAVDRALSSRNTEGLYHAHCKVVNFYNSERMTSDWRKLIDESL